MPEPMLVIRREQVAALAAAVKRGYVRTIAAFVRERAPDAVAKDDDAALEARVRTALRRGERRHLETEWDLGRFALLEVLHGPEFDEKHKWAAAAFGRADLEPGQRIDAAWNYHRAYLSAPARKG